ncbi:MAG: serine/threonine protein kinase [Chitinophagaceae bacterium]|nr:serine/threonine protein kinase [Oligoflexus sp.]
MSAPAPVLKIGPYDIEYEVGAGGLGRVFKSKDPVTGHPVAIKILHDRYQESRKFLGIFHRELLTVSRLKHKHIVGFVDASFDPPNCYIVSEFVDGWSLYKLMRHFGRIPPMVALCIAIDILQGIDYLHLHDTIHSDLSSPNVLISNTGKVLVTDFGLACNGAVENYKNYMVGTPGYYSPEHIAETSIINQSDLYCVGLLIFEMISGEKAVKASKDRAEIVQAMKNIDYGAILSDDPKMQSMLRSLSKGSLRFNPLWRYRTAESMIFEIYKILKRFDIRYSRYAIRQFLADSQMAAPVSEKNKQDIYHGFQK